MQGMDKAQPLASGELQAARKEKTMSEYHDFHPQPIGDDLRDILQGIWRMIKRVFGK